MRSYHSLALHLTNSIYFHNRVLGFYVPTIRERERDEINDGNEINEMLTFEHDTYGKLGMQENSW